MADWALHPYEGDKLLFVFDGGTLNADQLGVVSSRPMNLPRMPSMLLMKPPISSSPASSPGHASCAGPGGAGNAIPRNGQLIRSTTALPGKAGEQVC